MAQTIKRNERNKHYKSQMLTLFKNIGKWIKEGSVAKALSFFSEAQKTIDTAAKKNIIHKSNADRKKSMITRLINTAVQKGGSVSEVVSAPKKTNSPKSMPKKTTAKKIAS